jgi:hypothetical protein
MLLIKSIIYFFSKNSLVLIKMFCKKFWNNVEEQNQNKKKNSSYYLFLSNKSDILRMLNIAVKNC